jgi:hypothetical protein
MGIIMATITDTTATTATTATMATMTMGMDITVITAIIETQFMI